VFVNLINLKSKKFKEFSQDKSQSLKGGGNLYKQPIWVVKIYGKVKIYLEKKNEN